jgi:WD40 repeat protein
MPESGDNPYVGPRPYERADRPLFFGRESEVRQVTSLVIAHRVVLMYATSGAGKTSLLNAGLLPALEDEEGFEVFPPVRVAAAELSGGAMNPFVHNVIENWRRDVAAGSAFDAEGEPSLGQFLGSREHPLDRDGLAMPRLVVLDQFEEVFTLYREQWRQREPFFLQLAEALADDPLLRVLIAIREDYLAHLDRYGALLPGGLQTRLHLEQLRRDAALTAVTQLAARTPRRYAPGVAEQLVGDLLELRVDTGRGEIAVVEGEYVEPVQLQVVCRSLWEALPPDVVEIMADQLEEFGDVDEVLSDFYDEAVAAAAKAGHSRERRLRATLERTFITSGGTRGTVYAESGTTSALPDGSIDELERRHLIRAEFRAGARWLELTHDRLIDPIRTSNRAFFAARRRRRRRWGTMLAFAAGLALAGIGFYAWPSSTGPKPAVNSAAFSPDGKLIVTAVDDGTAQIWNVASGQSVQTLIGDLNDGVMSAMFSPDGKSVLTTTIETTRIWDVASGRLRLTLTRPTGRTGGGAEAAFSPNGKRVVAVNSDGTARIWEVATGRLLHTLGNTGGVNSAPVFSTNGRLVVTAGVDGTARIWDVASGRLLHALTGNTGGLNSAVFSPNGRLVVTAGQNARIWDVASGRLLHALTGDPDGLNSAVFSPNGRLVVTASVNGTARIWDVASGRLLHALTGDTDILNSAVFSPNGRLVVTASQDGTARIWDVATGRLLHALTRDTDAVISAVFSPNGRLVATASWDGTARIWDVATGMELGPPLIGRIRSGYVAPGRL